MPTPETLRTPNDLEKQQIISLQQSQVHKDGSRNISRDPQRQAAQIAGNVQHALAQQNKLCHIHLDKLCFYLHAY
jgi:hypothetical protein